MRDLRARAGSALAVASVTAMVWACGGGAAATPAASSASCSENPDCDHEVATGSTLTRFQRERLLGHYSTLDGASGFILDRTKQPWRAKLDGTPETLPLTESDGPLGAKEYRTPDHRIWLRVGPEGDVVLFQGPKQHEGVEVVRDADAAQLR